MRDALPRTPPDVNESAIINLDSSSNCGSHWTAFVKKNNIVLYFDSYGNLPPPFELVKYFGRGIQIRYNHNSFQSYDSYTCGHWCLKFLHEIG